MDDLGGAKVHSEITGTAHLTAPNDKACLDLIRKLISYLPANNQEGPPTVACSDDPDRLDDTLEEIVPANLRKTYDMRKVIMRIVDSGDFLELLPKYARNIVIGFGRMEGRTIGVVANQPLVLAGSLDVNASDKAARFIRFCDAFNIPLVNLVDVPGYFPGAVQEHAGIIRHGAKMLYAYAEATVPKVTLALRKDYGGSVMAMCCMGMGVDQMLAWPVAQLVVLDTATAVNLIFRKEITASEEPEAFRKEKIAEYDLKYSNPFHAAANMLVDTVIKPRETRLQLIKALRMLRNKERPSPARRHGNIPL
jgi:acetyl-CoA carboxylase carboxyltransferase component